jgi:hypothetical protein
MAREEDKARSVPPITSGSLSYKAGTAPGATVTLPVGDQGVGDQGIVTMAWVGGARRRRQIRHRSRLRRAGS